MKPIEIHDVIYLQWPYEGDEWRETTWSYDRIYDNDIIYLRETPKRKAADELYEALKAMDEAYTTADHIQQQEACEMMVNAIRLADGD